MTTFHWRGAEKEIGPLVGDPISFSKEKRGEMKKHEKIYVKHMLCLLSCFLLMTLVYWGTMTLV